MTSQPVAQTASRTEDVGMTVFLVVLVSMLFFVFPLVETGVLGRSMIGLGISLILATGVFAMAEGRRKLRSSALVLAAVALVTEWTCTLLDLHHLREVAVVAALLFVAIVTFGMLVQVVRPGRITPHRIRGAMAVYLMMGLLWAMAYTLVDIVIPGSFELPPQMAESQIDPEQRRLPSMVYFSFVTLTTVGYGEIVPTGSMARSLALLEALIGPLYLSILVARLVSLEIAHSMASRSK